MGRIFCCVGAVLTAGFLSFNVYGLASDGTDDNCGTSITALASEPSGEITFVIDTNIIYDYPDVLLSLDLPGNNIVIPLAVLEELDRHKSLRDLRAQDSRAFSRKLRQLIDEAQEKKATGIILPGGARLSFDAVDATFDWKKYNLDSTKPDHQILAVSFARKEKNTSRVVTLSGDNNVVIRAFSSQLEIANPETVLKDKTGLVKVNKDQLSPPLFVKIPASKYEHLRTAARIEVSEFKALGIPEDADLFENQYIVFELETEGDEPEDFDLEKSLKLVWRYRDINGEKFLKHVNQKKISSQAILPRSVEQIIAADLLLDPKVQLVNLIGKAGTGKTLLALTAAMTQSTFFNLPHAFKKIVIVRPNQESGKSMGFLPGALEEKLDPYLAAFRDQLARWIEAYQDQNGVKGTHVRAEPSVGDLIQEEFDKRTHGSRNRKPKAKKRSPAASKKFDVRVSLDDLLKGSPEDLAARLIESGQVTAEALAYIRGRTFRDTIIIVDETQNLKFEEVQLLATRLGENSKIIFLGDPKQRDTRELTDHNNGLMIMGRKIKGSPLGGTAVLIKGERSALAELVADMSN